MIPQGGGKRMQINYGQHLSIEQLQDQYLNQTKVTKAAPVTTKDGKTFQEILNQKTWQDTSEVKFSKHAANRLADRNIELTNNQLERLNEGANKAGEKGIKDSLVIVDQFAFIVNIPNKTVVTAMDQTGTQENIFTNIDGAVIN